MSSVLPELQSFQVEWYDLEQDKQIKELFLSHTRAACNSATKYSDYSNETIETKFQEAKSMYAVLIPSKSGIIIPAAFALMNSDKSKILLLFTLPAGKGHMMVSRLIGHIKIDVAHDQKLPRLECDTNGFQWISGPCISHNFVKENEMLSRTNILYFNVKPAKQLPCMTPTLSTDDILEEKTFEHAPITQANFEEFGPVVRGLLKSLLDQKIVNDVDLPRIRIDVRKAMLRDGQSSNPVGVHSDFIPTEEKTGYFCNPVDNDDLIILVSFGKPGTIVYTSKFGVPITTSDWCKVWREPAFQEHVFGEHAPKFVSQDGCPIIMNNMTLHSAQFLQAEKSQSEARLMIRFIVYSPSRQHLVPKKAAKGISQIYTPVAVM